MAVGSSAAGVVIIAEEGTANGDRSFTCTNNVSSDVVGTDALTFVRYDSTFDHGLLLGLGDDDHTQYLLVAGTRAMTGNLDMGDNSIINIGDLEINNPAATFQYVTQTSAITADRNVTLPLLTTNDTFLFENNYI